MILFWKRAITEINRLLDRYFPQYFSLWSRIVREHLKAGSFLLGHQVRSRDERQLRFPHGDVDESVTKGTCKSN